MLADVLAEEEAEDVEEEEEEPLSRLFLPTCCSTRRIRAALAASAAGLPENTVRLYLG